MITQCSDSVATYFTEHGMDVDNAANCSTCKIKEFISHFASLNRAIKSTGWMKP